MVVIFRPEKIVYEDIVGIGDILGLGVAGTAVLLLFNSY